MPSTFPRKVLGAQKAYSLTLVIFGMVITYHGHECFKLTVGDFTVGYNPYSKEYADGKGVRFGADLALSSINHPQFNAADALSYGEKEPFVITGPGEYEVGGTYVKGAGTNVRFDGEDYINTVYYLTLEGIRMCFLGVLSSPEQVTDAVRETVGEVDILFVPISEEAALSPREAHKLAVSFGPAMIIPMLEAGPKSKVLKQFLEEATAESAEPLERLTVKRKDFDGKEGEIAVLSAQ